MRVVHIARTGGLNIARVCVSILSHHETEKLRNLTTAFEERVRKLPQIMSKTAEDIEVTFGVDVFWIF